MQRKRFTVSVEQSPRSPFWQARMYLEGEGGRARRWSTGILIGNDRRVSEREATRKAEERAAQIAGEVQPEPVDGRHTLDEVADRMLEFKSARRRERAVDALAFNLDKHVKPYFGPLINTRLRRYEALAIKWEWVDLEHEVIRIPGDVRKGGKEQRVPTPMNATVAALLRDRQKRERQPSKGRVWFQLKGGRKGARDYDQLRRAAAAKAGIAGFRHHDARHTRATWLGASGASAIDLRDAMNWETMAMVGLYTHPEQERVRELADRVEFSATGSATGQRGSRGKHQQTLETGEKRATDGKSEKLKAI